MSIFQAIISGIVQGLAEFLPISSSGHLVLFSHILGISDPASEQLFFDTMLHIGTLISVFVIFWKDIVMMVKGLFGLLTGKTDFKKYPYNRLTLMLIIATIPLVLIIPFKDYIENMMTVPFVSAALIITGIMLWFGDTIKNGKTGMENTKFKNGFFVGLFQAFAVIPGISRSGSTVVGSLLNGLNREFAVKFSFLLSIPAILGATVVQIPDAVKTFESANILPYACGMLVAAIVGILAIKFFVKILSRGGLRYFAVYCWLVGGIGLICSFFIL